MEHSKNHIRLSQRFWLTSSIALLILAASHMIWARPAGEELAMSLRINVVRIAATHKDGGPSFGFGFIVGQRRRQLFIVTADHVVHDATHIEINYFSDQLRKYQATLVKSDTDLDLAVLQAESPFDMKWDNHSLVRIVERGTDVWFIGRSQEWYVPTIPGSINDVSSNSIIIDKLDILPGTSGAPLIAVGGTIGMIRLDVPGVAVHAIPIGEIESRFERWQLPWSLFTRAGEAPIFVPGILPSSLTSELCASVSTGNNPISLRVSKEKKEFFMESGKCVSLEPGTYSITTSGIAYIGCEPVDVEIQTSQRRSIRLTCDQSLRGIWDHENGYLELKETDPSKNGSKSTHDFEYYEYDVKNNLLGEGVADLKGSVLVLKGKSSRAGSYVGELKVDNYEMKGDRVFSNGSKDLLVFRRPQF